MAFTDQSTFKRRKLLRMTGSLIVSQEEDPESHADPAKRGGYLIYHPPEPGQKGRMPEIVLDGLATADEQRAAEARCERELEALRSKYESSATPPGRSSGRTPPPRQEGGARATLLGQRLVAQGLLRPEQLYAALERQKGLPPEQRVRRIGSLLVQEGHLSMRHLAEALGQQRGLPAVSGLSMRVDPPLRALFPLDLLLQIEAAPLCVVSKTVAVAMVDPQRREHVARLQALTGHQVRPMQAPQVQVHGMIASMTPGSGLTPRPPGNASASASSSPGARSGASASLKSSSISSLVPAPRGASETPRRK
jgi:hypothetical protein